LTRLARRGLLRDKKILLFGASFFSREVKNCLSELGFAIDGVIDNDSRKIGIACMGMRVQRPEDALLPYDDGFVVLILSGGFYREMTRQLRLMGYSENRHVFVLNFKIDESPPVMAYAAARTIRGNAAYRKLMQGMPEKSVLFIAPYTGTGDIYLIGLFFREYLRRNGISEYVFVVVSGACKKVAEMFGIWNIVVVKPAVADDMIHCRCFLREDWPVVVLNDGWLGEPSQWLRGYKGLHFEKVFRRFVFGFDDSVPFALPPKMDCREETDALFLKHGLKKGETVVLSPYSNTLFDLPGDLWRRIVEHCKGLGYAVCTNCAGASEKAIAGTEAVFFPLSLAKAFLDAAGYFIGVRSGLCDIISASSCKKIVLYEKDGFFYKCSSYAYFGLARMGLCGDATEIEYRDDIREGVFKEIKDALRPREVN
jgi:hypothetical protein